MLVLMFIVAASPLIHALQYLLFALCLHLWGVVFRFSLLLFHYAPGPLLGIVSFALIGTYHSVSFHILFFACVTLIITMIILLLLLVLSMRRFTLFVSLRFSPYF